MKLQSLILSTFAAASLLPAEDITPEQRIGGIQIEDACSGHPSRVKKFLLQKKSGSGWENFHRGNGLLEPVTTSAIRLNMLDASEGPTIAEVFLIQQP